MCYGSSYFAAFSTLIKPHVSSINVGPVLVYYPEEFMTFCSLVTTHSLSTRLVLAHLGQLYGSLYSRSYTLPKLLKCNRRYIFVSASERSTDLSIPKGKSLGFRTREKISACITRTKSRSLKLDFVQKDETVPPLKFPFDLE